MNYDSIGNIVKNLRLDYKELSNYELLSIAVQQQRNEILVSGLGVRQDNKFPAFIEAIGIQMGFKIN